MPVELVANDVSTTVAAAQSAVAAGTVESWTVASSSGFPAASSSATPPTAFRIQDPAQTGEIMLVTNVSGTTWTVQRGAEGTPTTHAAGFTVRTVFSAQSVRNIMRQSGYINVKGDFSAKGDGTGDYAAVQAALNAVPASGGFVWFDPGDYVNNVAPWVPKAHTKLMGTHVPRYQSTTTAESSCRLRVGTGFSGAGLIAPAANTRGLGIEGLCLTGAGVGTGIHGIESTAATQAGGELGWNLRDVQINGFTGSGFHGSQWVGTWENVHLDHNSGWGLLVDGAHWFTDVKMGKVFTYFNQTGGWNWDTTGQVGLIEVLGARVERSGGNHANVQAPLNADAPGIRIKKMSNSSFTNVSTDANTGHGIDPSVLAAGQGGNVVDVTFVNCTFKRDGYGNGVTQPDKAGVYLKGVGVSGADAVQYLGFVNCKVVVGRAQDGGTWPAYLHPMRGLWIENTQFIDWIAGRAGGSASSYYMGTGGSFSNYRATIIDSDKGIVLLPQGLPADRPTEGVMRGSVFFNYQNGALEVADGNGNWRPTTDPYRPVQRTVTAGTTAALDDVGKVVEFNNTAAAVFTIPINVFPVGAVLYATRVNTATVTVTGATGVTVNNTSAGSSTVGLGTQWGTAVIRQRSTNNWVVTTG